MNRAAVVAVARGWIGTPFVPQQSRKGFGCDCAGLVIGVARELGLVPLEFNPGPYSQAPHNHKLSGLCSRYMRQIQKASAVPGDVVEIRFDKDPQHLAILVDYPGGRLAVIHALTLSKKVVEHRLDRAWYDRITAAYALPGVA